MRGFETDQLRTFVMVADSGSLSAAAPKLFLSQSSVSEQLRKLEERAGVPLLTRGKKGAAPTPAGVRLLEHARRILALNELALQELHGHTLEGELRLAVTDYFRPGEIAGMLRRLRERYPYLRLHVTVMKSAAIDAAAEMDAFDIGLSMRLVGTRGQAGGGRGVLLRRESLAWVAAQGEAEGLPETLPLVLLPELPSPIVYVMVDEVLPEAGADLLSVKCGTASDISMGMLEIMTCAYQVAASGFTMDVSFDAPNCGPR